MADHPFNKGDKVEISMDEEGLRGSWFTATVIKPPPKRGKNKKLTIEYDTLLSEEDETKLLREIVELIKVRPAPPREAESTFRLGDEVDAFYNDGWWEGIVMEVLEGSRYSIYFRCSGEKIEVDVKDLRVHLEWRDGVWVPPLQQEQNASASTSGLNRENEIKGELYSKGNQVEVSSDEDGYIGAWFSASVVEVLGKEMYLIQYHELRTEDDTDFVKEEVDALHIRPTPPKIEVERFKLSEEVDALHNDGWWVGIITSVYPDSTYLVHFKESNEDIKFTHDELRPHQDWVDGKWVTSSKALHLGN